MSGDLDTTFGTGGFVTTNFGLGPFFQNYGQSIAIQTDGKIVMGGYVFDNSSGGTSTNHFTLARYNTDGSLDTSFGTGGLVVTPNFTSGSSDICFSIGIQSDGKIIMCGQTTPSSSNYSFALARYTTTGTLDTTFGLGTGIVTTSFGSFISPYTKSTATSLVIQPNGLIILGGSSLNTVTNKTKFALARYNTNGTLDTTFGSGVGLVITDFGTIQDELGFSITLQSNGYIVLGGQISSGSVYDFAIVRYDTQGNLDASFGVGGLYKLNVPTFNSYVASIKVQTNDYIVFGGTTSDPTSVVPQYWLLGRLDTTGTLDPTFGTGGTVSTSLTSPSTLSANSVAIQTDGKIVVGGTYNLNSSAAVSFALARYTTNGTLDTSFGSAGNGLILTDLIASPDEEIGQSLAIQTDGKILLGGYGGVNNDTVTDLDFILARYLNITPTPTPDPYPTPVSNICFPAGTPVVTDQGNIPIEQLDPEIHTIRTRHIVAITQTTMNENNIVCIEKHAFEFNVPNRKTYISNNHGILYNKKLIPAKQLVGRFRGIYHTKYNGEVLYNILMEKHYIININNMRVETLNPKNIVAKLYTSNYNNEEKMKLILEINEISKRNMQNATMQKPSYNNYNNYNNFERNRHNTTVRKLSILRYNPNISRLNFHTKRNFMQYHNYTNRNNHNYTNRVHPISFIRNNPTAKINMRTFRHNRRRR